MNILIIGSGGREHALAWRLARDAEVQNVFVMPGNPGMNEPNSKITTVGGEVSFEHAAATVREKKISLVVIGPEKFLFDGWVDQFQAAGIAAYGSSKAASFLEESKIKSKVFMRECGIATSAFDVAHSLEEAHAIIQKNPNWNGYVLKLSGPALGKGVIVTKNAHDAKKAAEDFFKHRPPGIEEGMVIEERANGREVSLFYVCMGDEYRFLASACDHKRLKDNDQGPNTGGMGAYSPANWLNATTLAKIEKEFVVPTLKGMKARGTPFSGTLFLGLMIDGLSTDLAGEVGANTKFNLLEYNTRFGDPETQTFLPLLEGDFAGLLHAAASNDVAKFKSTKLSPSQQHAVHIVKAAKGYPGLFGETIESGKRIEHNPTLIRYDSQIFFAGVRAVAGSSGTVNLETSGGRVLGLTSVAKNISKARANAYADLSAAIFENEHFRKDIAATADNSNPANRLVTDGVDA